MDLSKSYEFFQPEKIGGTVHIIGCGSVGSTIAENLVRCGVKDIALWDFDNVEAHNIVNQMFTQDDVGKPKVEGLRNLLTSINPDIKSSLKVYPSGWNGETLSGYIFLCVDSIEIRRAIMEKHMFSTFVKAVFDVRTMLTGAQHYAADWDNLTMKKNLYATMDFTHDEAAEAAPVSACGVTLGVVTTVRLISAMCVNNFIKFVKGEKIWKFVQIDGFSGIMDCFN